MPSPMETLFRTQLSPVPAHTTLGFEGSTVTAPMDCTSGVSKTGLKLVPPFTDFQTPPLADPTKTVSRPFSLTAVTAEMRPLIVADPMLRAGKPEIVPASYLTGCCPRTVQLTSNDRQQHHTSDLCSVARTTPQAIISSEVLSVLKVLHISLRSSRLLRYCWFCRLLRFWRRGRLGMPL